MSRPKAHRETRASFELFRLLSRLANLRLSTGRSERPLSPEEIALAAKRLWRAKERHLQGAPRNLDLDPNTRFAGIAREGKQAGCRRRATATAAAGTYALRDALGEAPWESLVKTPEKLDRIAEVLSFREDLDRIAKE